jgi:excisionase family DNA binding protein
MSAETEEPAVLTIEEAAKLLRISRRSAYEAAHNKHIPTVRIGRRLLVPKDRLRRLLDGTDQ